MAEGESHDGPLGEDEFLNFNVPVGLKVGQKIATKRRFDAHSHEPIETPKESDIAQFILPSLRTFLPNDVIQKYCKDPVLITDSEDEFFAGIVLFVDVVGFTATTERLCQCGLEGLEELSYLLNGFFSMLVKIVQEHHGDIVKFAGDALFVLWKNLSKESARHNSMLACQCALTMQERIATYRISTSALTEQQDEAEAMQIRISVGRGQIRAVHLGGAVLRGQPRWDYLIMGEPITQVALGSALAEPGEVVISDPVRSLIKDECAVMGQKMMEKKASARESRTARKAVNVLRFLEMQDEGFFVLKQIVLPVPLPKVSETPISIEAVDALKAYVSPSVLPRLGQTTWLADLRRVTTLFVTLAQLSPQDMKKMSLEELQNIFYQMQSILFSGGGVVRQFLVDDKGPVLIGAFGLPMFVHEDDAVRGVGVAMDICEYLRIQHNIAAAVGITTDKVFCGAVGSDARREYAMVGDPINLAARLMGAAAATVRKASEGDSPSMHILVDKSTYELTNRHITYNTLVPISVKGKQMPIPVYSPQSFLRHRSHHGSKRRDSYRRHDSVEPKVAVSDVTLQVPNPSAELGGGTGLSRLTSSPQSASSMTQVQGVGQVRQREKKIFETTMRALLARPRGVADEFNILLHLEQVGQFGEQQRMRSSSDCSCSDDSDSDADSGRSDDDDDDDISESESEPARPAAQQNVDAQPLTETACDDGKGVMATQGAIRITLVPAAEDPAVPAVDDVTRPNRSQSLLPTREHRQSLVLKEAAETRGILKPVTDGEATACSPIIMLLGEAGIGKSYTIKEVKEMAKSLEFSILQANGDAHEKSTPYYAWRSVFHSLFQMDSIVVPEEEYITEILALDPILKDLGPLLAPVLSVSLPETARTRALKGAVRAKATRMLLLRLIELEANKGKPLLLVIEDCHWIDSASWALAYDVATFAAGVGNPPYELLGGVKGQKKGMARIVVVICSRPPTKKTKKKKPRVRSGTTQSNRHSSTISQQIVQRLRSQSAHLQYRDGESLSTTTSPFAEDSRQWVQESDDDEDDNDDTSTEGSTETNANIIRLPREFQEIRRLPNARMVRLYPLSKFETVVLVSRRLGVDQLPTKVVDMIMKKAKGNPFFSEQIAFSMMDLGEIVVKNGRCFLSERSNGLFGNKTEHQQYQSKTSSLGRYGTNQNDTEKQLSKLVIEESRRQSSQHHSVRLSVPDDLLGIITSRIDALTEGQQLILKVASIIGRVFSLHLLYSIHPVAKMTESLTKDINTLVARDLLVKEEVQNDWDQAYSFKHYFTQEAAYGTLLYSHRRQLHVNAAKYHEKYFEQGLEIYYPLLSYHYSRAEEYERSLLYLDLAAEYSLRTFASHEAIGFLSKALALAGQLKVSIGPIKHASWELGLGECLYNVGELAKAGQHVSRALNYLDVSLSKTDAGIRWQIGLLKVALKLLPPNPLEPPGCMPLGFGCPWQGSRQTTTVGSGNESIVTPFDESENPARDALEALEAPTAGQRHKIIVRALLALSEVKAHYGKDLESAYCALSALMYARQLNTGAPELLEAFGIGVRTAGLMGDHAFARNLLQRGLQCIAGQTSSAGSNMISRALDTELRARDTVEPQRGQTVASFMVMAGTYYSSIGDWKHSGILLRRAVELSDQIGHSWLFEEASYQLSTLLYFQGQLEESGQHLHAAFESGRRRGDRHCLAQAWSCDLRNVLFSGNQKEIQDTLSLAEYENNIHKPIEKPQEGRATVTWSPNVAEKTQDTNANWVSSGLVQSLSVWIQCLQQVDLLHPEGSFDASRIHHLKPISVDEFAKLSKALIMALELLSNGSPTSHEIVTGYIATSKAAIASWTWSIKTTAQQATKSAWLAWLAVSLLESCAKHFPIAEPWAHLCRGMLLWHWDTTYGAIPPASIGSSVMSRASSSDLSSFKWPVQQRRTHAHDLWNAGLARAGEADLQLPQAEAWLFMAKATHILPNSDNASTPDDEPKESRSPCLCGLMINAVASNIEGAEAEQAGMLNRAYVLLKGIGASPDTNIATLCKNAVPSPI